MTTATKIFQTSKFGLPNLASMYLNPGRSACPPFLNKVYRMLQFLLRDEMIYEIDHITK